MKKIYDRLVKYMFISVPFKTRNSNGVSHIEGIGKFSPAGVVLEFESKLFGIISSGVKESQISLADILDLTFHKGFLKKGAKIIIRLKNYSKLIEMPNRDGKITLQIPREDFRRASEAVELLNKNLAETSKTNRRRTRPSAVCSMRAKTKQRSYKEQLVIDVFGFLSPTATDNTAYG